MIDVGTSCTLEFVVDEQLSADQYGNPGVFVLATPAIVELVERAAMGIVRPTLEEGLVSVGTLVALEHRAPTPVGARIRVRAITIESDGSRQVFDVAVEDERGIVASGRHERQTVETVRFERLLDHRRR